MLLACASAAVVVCQLWRSTGSRFDASKDAWSVRAANRLFPLPELEERDPSESSGIDDRGPPRQ